jgi:hypothetical protein
MREDQVVCQINDDRKIRVLCPRHEKYMIEVLVIAAVDNFNESE